MSRPRRIVPGSTYLLTRRTSERRFFLSPDAFINNAFLFVLGYAAPLLGISVHAVTVMGNHWHAVLTDTRGTLPKFAQLVHRLTAGCFNVYRGRNEAFWSSGRYSLQRLETQEAVLKATVYVLANPVAAGLVKTAAEYPGLLLGPHEHLLDAQTAERPGGYFNEKGPMKEQEALTITKPPHYDDVADDDYVALVRRELEAAEEAHAARLAEAGREVAGAEAVCAVDWRSSPDTKETWRTLDPKVIEPDAAQREKMLKEESRFEEAYDRAMQTWMEGDYEVVFPLGTYLMRVLHGVACAATDDLPSTGDQECSDDDTASPDAASPDDPPADGEVTGDDDPWMGF